MTNADLLTRARGGDDDAFRLLTDPYRRELLAHCYRMLGSVADAQDALQETLLAAWQGLPGFGQRASVRTWLHRIATNRCLNALRTTRRRPIKAWDIPGVDPPSPTRTGETPWLGPFPDSMSAGVSGAPLGPESRYEQSESMSLAFVAALQTLPPRQLAVLVLRDVLGFRASEAADLLDTTVPSVNSSLTRARRGLEHRRAQLGPAAVAAAVGSDVEARIADRFVRAYESADVEALVALFTDDIYLAMPPMPLEYEGREAATLFFERLLVSGRRYSLIPTRANGSLAFGSYVAGPDDVRYATGLFAVTIVRGRLGAMTRFEQTELAAFGLPLTLPV